MPEIKKITLKDGSTVYRFVVDVGRHPETGLRQQRTFTFDLRREAQAELDRIRHQRRTGDYVMSSPTTVTEALDKLVPALCVDVEEATRENFADAVRPVRSFLGERRVQSLDEQDIDDLVEFMLTRGRVRGGKPGTGLGARTVALTLGRLRAVLNEAVRRKMVVRNVATHTRVPREARKQAAAVRASRTPWTEAEVKAFLRAIRDHRLFPVLMLAFMGMRPGEVCGLRWSDVDLDAGEVGIANTRTLVRREVIEKDTKSESGTRLLPVPAPVLATLKTFKARQAAERLAAGPAYTDTGYVLVDELGMPQRTDWLRRRAYNLMDEHKARRVRLYDARHATLTALAAAGVPAPIIAAWAGHSDGGQLAMRTYIKPSTEHLRVASDALARMLG